MDSAHARAERADTPDSRPHRPELHLVDEPPRRYSRTALPAVDEPPARDPETGRRTVRIRGQVAPPPRRRSPAAAQISARPDRVAMWAVMLGLFLVFMAVVTATP